MVHTIVVYFDWGRTVNENGTPVIHGYTFRPPEGMNYDGVVQYLNYHVGKIWQDDSDQLPGDDRAVFARQGSTLSDVYVPFEKLGRDDVVGVLEGDGFTRTDNTQEGEL